MGHLLGIFVISPLDAVLKDSSPLPMIPLVGK